MSVVVAAALLLSFVIYLYVGFSLQKTTRSIADLVPLLKDRQATVKNASEFSASTVATTLSLATIIIAYFELIPKLGLWLLWTVFTTVVGMAILAVAARRIWFKMSEYPNRPSLHEFLAVEYRSTWLGLVGAVCTSVGFLLIFAVELTVGARFLAQMLPEVPIWVSVPVLALVGFVYTAMGGFRAVVRTDFIQMRFIWLLILAMAVFIGVSYYLQPEALLTIPVELYNFSAQPGLLAFLVGIAVMNIPTHISNMSVWQRIAGSPEPETVLGGLWRSVTSSALSWGSLVVLALLTLGLTQLAPGENLLISFLKTAAATRFGLWLVFFVTLGLYGAMLSTASTQLIVVSHTLYEDIYSRLRRSSLQQREGKRSELRLMRLILFISAALAVGFVEVLNHTGFSVADLVFAIYGGQLVLFPIILLALYLSKERLVAYRKAANWAILLGFIMGWASAFLGNAIGNGSLVFLAPGVSIAVSFLVLWVGKSRKKVYQ